MSTPRFRLLETVEDTQIQWARELNNLANNLDNVGGYVAVNNFDHGVWQRNMIPNSDLRCAMLYVDGVPAAAEPADAEGREVRRSLLGYAFEGYGEGCSLAVEEDPLTPAAMRAAIRVGPAEGAVFGYAGTTRAGWEVPAHAAGRMRIYEIDPRPLVAEGSGKLLFSFYHAGEGLCSLEISGVDEGGSRIPLTLSHGEADWFSDPEGGRYVRPHAGVKRLVVGLDAAQAEDCRQIVFMVSVLGFDARVAYDYLTALAGGGEVPEPDPEALYKAATAYVSGFQMVADKHGGRLPAYGPGPCSEPEADGFPAELRARVGGSVPIVCDPETPVPVTLPAPIPAQIAEFNVPALPDGDVFLFRTSEVRLAVTTNAPAFLVIIASDVDPENPDEASFIGGTGAVQFRADESAAPGGVGATLYNVTLPILREDGGQDTADRPERRTRTVRVFATVLGFLETRVTFHGGEYAYEYDVYRGVCG